MSQTAVQSTSTAPFVVVGGENQKVGVEDRPVQEIIARRVCQRARRRLVVAALPLLLLTAVLAYFLAYHGI